MIPLIVVAIVFGVLLLFLGAIFRYYFNRPEARGRRGENYISGILHRCCRSEHDHVIDNIILFNQKNQSSSQIDHIFICQHGVCVIETKNYSGTIYGNDEQHEWTQVLAGGRVKNQLHSPVKQNATHIYLVKSILGKNVPVFGFVVFVQGNIENVYSRYVCSPSELQHRLLTLNLGNALLSATQQDEVYNTLCNYRDRYSVSEEEHLQDIYKMQSDIAANICPRCGGKLILRNGKYGQFYGCSNYPKCKFTKQLK